MEACPALCVNGSLVLAFKPHTEEHLKTPFHKAGKSQSAVGHPTASVTGLLCVRQQQLPHPRGPKKGQGPGYVGELVSKEPPEFAYTERPIGLTYPSQMARPDLPLSRGS